MNQSTLKQQSSSNRSQYNSQLDLSSVLLPSIAGTFYPAEESVLKELLSNLFEQAREEAANKIINQFKVFIAPHAGYQYSGLSAAHAYKYFEPKKFERVIVIGPAHKNRFEGLAVYPQDFYQTPLGKSPKQSISPSEGISIFEAPFLGEHSVEAHLPFLQYRLLEEGIDLEKYPITLMLYGDISASKLAKKIDNLVDEKTCLILSSDLSHFYDLKTCQAKDEASIQAVLSNVSQNVLKTADACGKLGISAFLETRLSRKFHSEFIHYSNSAATTHDESRVVGYCSIGYFQDYFKPLDANDPDQVSLLTVQPNWRDFFTFDFQRELLGFLRTQLKNYIANKDNPDLSAIVTKYPLLTQEAASFVTITIDGKLRGCIGSLYGSRPLGQDLMVNALKAACEDSRFKPMTLEELAQAKLEISVLHSYQLLKCSSEFEMLGKLQPNKHGVIIQKANQRATFLPQVWEQIPNKINFLSQLCKKGGFSQDAWRNQKERLQVITYEVIKFKESTFDEIQVSLF